MKKITDHLYVVKEYNPNSQDCCVYLVDSQSDEGLILIDAGINQEPFQEIKKFGFDLGNLKHCLITHGHLDHFGACPMLKEFNKNIKFYAHELDAAQIEQKPTGQYVEQFFGDYNYEPIKLDHKIKDNEILKFGDLEFRCIHIPGHTKGSVAYHLEIDEKKILFGGDLPGIAININDGNLDDYIISMEKLLKYDIDISCEGHEDIIEPSDKVRKFIKNYIRFNQGLNTVVLENPYDTKTLLELAKNCYELQFYPTALDFCNYLLEIDPNHSEGQELLREIEKHNPEKQEFIKRLIKENFKGELRI
ncbi:MAG: MBL fold metallo-hydrolase [Candidatus Lokiarchaeota archaeon]|nr:MBL fold metallo-hydrolase [Candidatus Lokiarchaeota archaeon]